MNWENLVFWPLSDSLTQPQKMKTIKKACSIPATPTIHDKRENRIAPKMFWVAGRNTP